MKALPYQKDIDENAFVEYSGELFLPRAGSMSEPLFTPKAQSIFFTRNRGRIKSV